jgi:predicted flap endonuclease-1-like 5' DNA nuclease
MICALRTISALQKCALQGRENGHGISLFRDVAAMTVRTIGVFDDESPVKFDTSRPTGWRNQVGIAEENSMR